MRAGVSAVGCMPLLDFAAASWEVLVYIFTVQEADKDDGILLKGDAYSVVSDSHTKIVTTASELLEV